MLTSMPAHKRSNQMIETLGNIGDFVGGIGVVITLAYLAVQVRQSAKAGQVAAAQAVMQSMSEFYLSASGSEKLAQIYNVAFSDFDS
jgi:hypothetical protein